MSNIEQLNFHGDEILVARGADGQGYAVLKRMCESLGVAEQSQAEKLKGLPWARTTMIVAHDSSGRNQELFCLHVDSVPLWLATIHPNKVATDARTKLVQYQREAARALADWAYGRGGSAQIQALVTALQMVLSEQDATKRELAAIKLQLSSSSNGMVTAFEAANIRAGIRNARKLWQACWGVSNWRRAQGQVTTRVRRAVDWPSTKWDLLPSARLPIAMREIESIEGECRRKLTAERAGRQLSLLAVAQH